MCECKNVPVSVFEKNGSNEIVAMHFSVPAQVGKFNTIPDGVVIPEEPDGNGKVVFKLKLTSDAGLPDNDAEKEIVHTFSLTPTQISALGFEENPSTPLEVGFEYYKSNPSGPDSHMIRVCTTQCWFQADAVSPYHYVCKTFCYWLDTEDDETYM